MFGIADTADSSSRGESADILGGNSEMPATYQKRHFSPGSTDALPPCVKQPRLDESCVAFYRPDYRNKFRSSSSSPRALSLATVLYGSGRRENTRDPGSDGRQSDEESSSDGRLSTREVSWPRDLELKDARVLLYDIKYNKNYRDGDNGSGNQRRTAIKSAKNSAKLWEVEEIVQKRVQKNQQPLYLIKWKNWDSKYNTWEPLRNLVNCHDLLREFDEERQKLIHLFKARINFYPNAHDAELLLAELRYKGIPIDDDSAIDMDKMYDDIRRYLEGPSGGKQEAKIKRLILHVLLNELRQSQLDSLRDWESEMNNITRGKPIIRVENLIDLESAPQDFYYIDNYLPGVGVTIPDDPPIGCECDVCETKSSCCFKQNGQSLPYTSANRIRVPPGTPIYECNKRCTCDLSCRNRVVQRGTDTQLCIFRTDNGRGWGVRTLRAIKKGTFVAQYVGEVISSEEAEKRGKEYDVTGRTYLFDLDYNETDGQCPYTVDAAVYGNVSHFINHSCDPNLAVYAIWINCLDPNLPNLALFAIKDIKQHEELTFDYTYQTSRGNEKMQQQLCDDSDTAVNVASKNKILCKCGARTCRRYLF